MKVSTKPISSPGRTEKFPPPLMRFLRTNVGSRSRGRSRASPMFMRKTKNSIIETTQEPSSPKVTCIGQVRVKRSKKNPQKNPQEKKKKPLCCCCSKLQIPKSSFPFLKKWVSCFRFGYCKRVETVESTQRVDNQLSSCISSSITENVENNEGILGNELPPPKNALFLTRCRSAPYRSSSLASRFWGSPLNSSEETTTADTEEHEFEEEQKQVCEHPVSENGENKQGSEENGGGYVHPLLLTRCKSEPARTGERLNPDNSKT